MPKLSFYFCCRDKIDASLKKSLNVNTLNIYHLDFIRKCNKLKRMLADLPFILEMGNCLQSARHTLCYVREKIF